MGRLHSKGKGISASAIPYSRNPPSWLKTTPEQVVDQICKLAKKGATPSQIGVILRDSHGVAQVRVVTGMLKSRPLKFSAGESKKKENFATDCFRSLQATVSFASSSPAVRSQLYEHTKRRLRCREIIKTVREEQSSLPHLMRLCLV